MAQMTEYRLGQMVQMKKEHPCGTNCWRIIRVGMDYRIKCIHCGRSVLMPRSRFERRVKSVYSEFEVDPE